MGSQVSADLESRNHKIDAPALSTTKSGPDNGEPASSELGKMTDKLLVFSSTPAEALSHVGSHTYGEVSAEGFAEILQLVQPQAGEVFVDLGSGTGKAVLTAAALHPFAKAVGVEFVAALHEASTRLVADFQKLAPSLPVYASGALPPPEIEMIPGDVTKVDWPAYAKTKQGATAVVFAACTCWSAETISSFLHKATKLKKGSRLVIMSRVVDMDKKLWKLECKTMARYGRGRMTFSVFRKIG